MVMKLARKVFSFFFLGVDYFFDKGEARPLLILHFTAKLLETPGHLIEDDGQVADLITPQDLRSDLKIPFLDLIRRKFQATQGSRDGLRKGQS